MAYLQAILMRNTFRQRRFRKFVSACGVTPGDSILDIGGLPHTWIGTGLESQVTLLNRDYPSKSELGLNLVVGDARNLEGFLDQSIDVVFSNSVIEHVGEFESQKRMASEITRVGKRFWIQTPYKHFPIEIHFLFPFFQYLPSKLRRLIARYWPFSFSKLIGLDPIKEAENIWLLDRSQMSILFPGAKIFEERFLGMTKSLIAVKR